jgi:RNA polymerase-binding transcription factor DksA
MDIADYAQLNEQLEREAALARAASLARQVLGHEPTSSKCEGCGAEVEAQRLKHGFSVCYACAEWRERWEAKWRHR